METNQPGGLGNSGQGSVNANAQESTTQPSASVTASSAPASNYSTGGGEKANPAFTVQTLNLPKGGGTVQGMGESAEVNALTGVAAMSIPIFATDCRGFTPGLSVSVSTGNGNGVVGFGADIARSSIRVSTQFHLPRYDAGDVFIFGDYLVPRDDVAPRDETLVLPTLPEPTTVDYTVTTYYQAVENQFSLIERWQDDDNAANVFWRVIGRDHTVQIYGYSDSARICDPNHTSHIFEWLLEEVYDTHGQHQLYRYKAENTDDFPIPLPVYEENRLQTANKYLERIQYGNLEAVADSMLFTSHSALDDDAAWHFELVLDYGEYDITPSNSNPYLPINPWIYRGDSFSTYSAGFEIRTHRLCRNVLMFHRFNDEFGTEDTPVLVHATQFHYEQESYTQLSQLKEVSATGYTYRPSSEDYVTTTTPGVLFNYAAFNPNDSSFVPVQTATPTTDKLVGINNGPNYTLVDLYGEGLPGILYTDGATTAFRSPQLADAADRNSPIVYGPAEVIDFPMVKQLLPEEIRLTDINADSKMDVVLNTPLLSGYFSMTTGPDRHWEKYQPFAQSPTERLVPQHQWVDMRGTSLLDLVILNQNTLRIYPAVREIGWEKAIETTRSTPLEAKDFPQDFPTTLTGSPTVLATFADVAGSGVAQFVQVSNGQVKYWPNLGYGKFADAITMANAPVFETDDAKFDVARLFLADISGSGLADLIYFHTELNEESGLRTSYMTIYINQNGNTFAAGEDIELPVLYDQLDQITFTDLTGKGSVGMLYSLLHAEGGPAHYYYDFTQAEKPFLLTEIDNQRGALTQINYQSSVRYFLQDKAQDKPWITCLPYPVMVVQTLTSHDVFTGTSSYQDYRYHHGYYEPFEREFRGFGSVETTTRIEFPAPIQDREPEDTTYIKPVLGKTWYHLGIDNPDLMDAYEAEYFAGDMEAFDPPEDVYDYGSGSPVPPNDQTKTQAYRALKGQVIRQEVYEQPTSEETNPNPYTVSYGNFKVRLRQVLGSNAYAIFSFQAREAFSYNYERVPTDPVIQQSVTLLVDDYNNVLQTLSITYPRRVIGDWANDAKVGWSRITVANATTLEDFQLGVPIESRAYTLNPNEITAPESGEALNFGTLADFIEEDVLPSLTSSPSSSYAQLVSWQRQYYAELEDDETVPLDFGDITLPLLPYQAATAVFIQGEVESLLGLGSMPVEALLTEGYYSNTEIITLTDYWWAYSSHPSYLTAEDFYLPSSITDPANHTVSYSYDTYRLLLQETVVPVPQPSPAAPILLTTTVTQFDYQRMMAVEMQDINDNTSAVTVDSLGRVIHTTHYGQEGGPSGSVVGFAPIANAPTTIPTDVMDVIENPVTYLGTSTTRMASFFYYDDWAYVNTKASDTPTPVTVVSLIASTYDVTTLNQESTVQITINYGGLETVSKVEEGPAFVYEVTDGTIDTDTTPTATPRWLNSGISLASAKAYDPFYLDSPTYIRYDVIAGFAQTHTAYVDALGRPYFTQTYQGFIQRAEWTAWQSRAYDSGDAILEAPYYLANKTGGSGTGPFYDPTISIAERDALDYAAIWYSDTPTITQLNNQGQPLSITLHNHYPDATNTPITELLTTTYVYGDYISAYRLSTVADPRLAATSQTNVEYHYGSLTASPLHVVQADGGDNWQLANVFGNPIYHTKSRTTTLSFAYDTLQRIISVTVNKSATTHDALVLSDVMVKTYEYGEGISDAKDYNLCGKVYELKDEAGVIITPSFTITSQPLSSSRTLCEAYKTAVDWNTSPTLQSTTYTLTLTYDALGRTVTETDVKGNITTPTYYVSGRLAQVDVALQESPSPVKTYVSAISYNALNQRLTQTMDNGLITTTTYDLLTHRVRQIVTGSVQNLSYDYDPLGNVIAKTDNTFEPLYYCDQEVTGVVSYQYDAISRIIKTQGYQHQPSQPVTDFTAVENYIEKYTYDTGNNLTKRSRSGCSTTTTVETIIANSSNQGIAADITTPTPDPEDVHNYFDLCGNVVALNTSIAPLAWDYRNQLQSAVTVVRSAPAENDAEYYVYDGQGQRIRKVFQHDTGSLWQFEETIYLGGIEIRQTLSGSTSDVNAATVNNSYYALRVAAGEGCAVTHDVWTTGSPPAGFSSGCDIYHLTDILRSTVIDVDDVGAFINQSEYYAFGGTAISNDHIATADTLRHYRYSGKELDSVTGLYYYGARYYNSLLGRWLNPDPAGFVDGLNLYAFVNNNPVTCFDTDGMFSVDASPRANGPFFQINITGRPTNQNSIGILNTLVTRITTAQSAIPSGTLTVPANTFLTSMNAGNGQSSTIHIAHYVSIDEIKSVTKIFVNLLLEGDSKGVAAKPAYESFLTAMGYGATDANYIQITSQAALSHTNAKNGISTGISPLATAQAKLKAAEQDTKLAKAAVLAKQLEIHGKGSTRAQKLLMKTPEQMSVGTGTFAREMSIELSKVAAAQKAEQVAQNDLNLLALSTPLTGPGSTQAKKVADNVYLLLNKLNASTNNLLPGDSTTNMQVGESRDPHYIILGGKRTPESKAIRRALETLYIQLGVTMSPANNPQGSNGNFISSTHGAGTTVRKY